MDVWDIVDIALLTVIGSRVALSLWKRVSRMPPGQASQSTTSPAFPQIVRTAGNNVIVESVHADSEADFFST